MAANTVIDYTIIFPATAGTEENRQQYLSSLSGDLEDYIWHKEEFNLNIQGAVNVPGYSTLFGSTNVGENINDEWFIVYLLMEISERFTDVLIQVSDTDENFLLIEAADHLPKWLKPENSENRVFLHNGNLHIIPYPTNPSEVTSYPAGVPTLQHAYQTVVNKETKTQASDSIQGCIKARIKEYPDKVHEDFHHAHCYLPNEIVYMLHKLPSSVAPAVEAFYNRDPVDVKVSKSLPSFDASKRLLTRVRFTKHLYCQLSQARFMPDRRTPWALPPTKDQTYKSKELGFKLAYGFEMLLSRYKSTKENGQPYGKKWQSYLKNLKKNDFFQGELEGSKKYKELLEDAKVHFKEHVQHDLDPFGERLVKLYDESANYIDDMIKLNKELTDEDDDSWMTVTPEELDNMMLGMWGANHGNVQDVRNENSNQHDEKSAENLAQLVDKMKLFVDKVSTYEGVETPCEEDEKGVNEKINFDPKAFMQSISDILSPPKVSEQDEMFSDSDDEDVDDDFVSCKPGFIENDENGFHEVMQSMDDELKYSSIPRSFQDSTKETEPNEEDLDYDINLLRNFLESFQNQDGLSGPVSNILNSLGMSLPPNLDEKEKPENT